LAWLSCPGIVIVVVVFVAIVVVVFVVVLTDGSILSVGCKPMDRSMVIGKKKNLPPMIDTIGQKLKIFSRWIDTIGGNHNR